MVELKILWAGQSKFPDKAGVYPKQYMVKNTATNQIAYVNCDRLGVEELPPGQIFMLDDATIARWKWKADTKNPPITTTTVIPIQKAPTGVPSVQSQSAPVIQYAQKYQMPRNLFSMRMEDLIKLYNTDVDKMEPVQIGHLDNLIKQYEVCNGQATLAVLLSNIKGLLENMLENQENTIKMQGVKK